MQNAELWYFLTKIIIISRLWRHIHFIFWIFVYLTIDKAHNKPIVIARRKAPWQSQKPLCYKRFPRQLLLRCPIKSSGLRWSSILSTAATRSGRFSRHRRRSHRSHWLGMTTGLFCIGRIIVVSAINSCLYGYIKISGTEVPCRVCFCCNFYGSGVNSTTLSAWQCKIWHSLSSVYIVIDLLCFKLWIVRALKPCLWIKV